MTWGSSPVLLSTAWASPSSPTRALRRILKPELLFAFLKTGASRFRASSFIIPAAASNQPRCRPSSKPYGFKFGWHLAPARSHQDACELPPQSNSLAASPTLPAILEDSSAPQPRAGRQGCNTDVCNESAASEALTHGSFAGPRLPMTAGVFIVRKSSAASSSTPTRMLLDESLWG